MKLKWFKSGNGEKNAAKLTLYLLGNPNVGKSTVFNAFDRTKTAHRQLVRENSRTPHSENIHITISNTKIIDLPGTHAVNSCFSEEEVTGTRNYAGLKKIHRNQSAAQPLL